MSRLTQPPIEDGDPINAASLNDRFTQFAQPAGINAFNTRDAAFDLPAFNDNARFLAKGMAVSEMGYNQYKHAFYNTFSGQTTGALPWRVLDSGGFDESLSFGPLGFTLVEGDALRVYWDLSIRPRWEGAARPWLLAALNFSLPQSGGGVALEISNGYGCWAFWLQWDITDNTLSNFVNVPGQGDFNTPVVATRGGEQLNNCKSTSVAPAILEYADVVDEGELSGAIVTTPVGWTSVDGSWHYVRPSGSVTVYGVRVVFSGPFGAYHSGTQNYLVRNDVIASSARLDQQAGSIQALHMRTK